MPEVDKVSPELRMQYDEHMRKFFAEWEREKHDLAVIRAVTEEVVVERVRQDRKWGEQNHPDGTGSPEWCVDSTVCRAIRKERAAAGTVTWLDILREEAAEAFAESDPAKLRAELIQVAAVAAAWVQAIDRRAQ